MGYFHNNIHNNNEIGSTGQRHLLSLAAALLVLWPAPLATAEAAEADTGNEGRVVSTSPVPGDAIQLAAPTAQPPARPHRPLTRAAAKQRIEKISPRAWLARYGPVDVTRRD